MGGKKKYINIFGSFMEPFISYSAHHSMVFYFRYSVYWWKGSVRF